MFVNNCLNVNEKGDLTIGGVDTVELAEKYSTPLIVYSENSIRENMRALKSSIDSHYDSNGLVLYASKAFCCKEICKIADEEGLGLDVVSGGELYTAQKANFPMEKIYFHGNNKTVDELEFAVKSGVGTIVVDNEEEIENLNSVCEKYGKKQNIYMRIKPGIDAHTHSFIRTGQIDSKFGFALENGEAMECVKLAAESENLNLKGLHCHIGSQIFDTEPFVLAAEVMLKFISDIKNEIGIEIDELDLGGGFGIRYLESDNPIDLEKYMAPVSDKVHEMCGKLGIKLPKILIEPGRSIAGDSAVTLYTVGSVKEIKDIRTYVAVDGGMTDNPRYILYQSDYTCLVANKADKPRDTEVTVAGKCCESGDLIQENTKIQATEKGDILAVLSTGAYCYSMASNYNRVPRPTVVFVKDGVSRVVVRRETYEDIVSLDC